MEELAKHVHQEMVTMRRRADEADALDSSIRGRWGTAQRIMGRGGAAARGVGAGR